MAEWIPFLIAFAFIALVAGALLGAWHLSRRGRDQDASRLKQRLGEDAPLDIQEKEVETDSWFGRLAAGAGRGMTVEIGLLMLLAGGLLFGGTLYLWLDNELAALIGFIVGLLAGLGILMNLRARRERAILHQLPDVMMSLARAVRSGETLDQAFARVGRDGGPPLGPEFARVASQLEFGLSLDAAMRALVRRNPIMEMRLLASTLIVQRKTGGNLTITLERLAHVIRDRISYRRQFRAATAAGRISAIVIALAAPLVFLYFFLFETEYVEPLLFMPLGNILLILAVVLQLLGIFFVYRILRNDY